MVIIDNINQHVQPSQKITYTRQDVKLSHACRSLGRQDVTASSIRDTRQHVKTSRIVITSRRHDVTNI